MTARIFFYLFDKNFARFNMVQSILKFLRLDFLVVYILSTIENFLLETLLAMGFYIHHSGILLIHHFGISYFPSVNLATLSGYKRYQRAKHTCKVSDRLD